MYCGLETPTAAPKTKKMPQGDSRYIYAFARVNPNLLEKPQLDPVPSALEKPKAKKKSAAPKGNKGPEGEKGKKNLHL